MRTPAEHTRMQARALAARHLLLRIGAAGGALCPRGGRDCTAVAPEDLARLGDQAGEGAQKRGLRR